MARIRSRVLCISLGVPFSSYRSTCDLFLPIFLCYSHPSMRDFSLQKYTLGLLGPRNGILNTSAGCHDRVHDTTHPWPIHNNFFTPPPECNFAAVRGTPLSIGFRAQTCVGNALEDESTCWPEATVAAPSPMPPFHGWGFYSPGISFPAGYTTACDATQGYRTGWVMQYPLEKGETAVGCCPTYVMVTHGLCI